MTKISAALRVKQTTKERTEGNVAGLGRGLDIPLAPPVMLLRSKNFFRNSLRSAAPPTPEQADSAIANSWASRPGGGTQNPPVLLPPERACSIRKHPLSSVSGRQRYNTLDLASKVVCHETAGFIGFFRPRRVLPSIGFHPPRERCPLCIHKPTGRSRPYWMTPSQRNCHPFGIPARFEMSTHKQESVFVYTHFKT